MLQFLLIFAHSLIEFNLESKCTYYLPIINDVCCLIIVCTGVEKLGHLLTHMLYGNECEFFTFQLGVQSLISGQARAQPLFLELSLIYQGPPDQYNRTRAQAWPDSVTQAKRFLQLPV